MSEFLVQVWQLWVGALTFDAALLGPILAVPLWASEYTGAVLTIALAAGISKLLGDSVVLFVNRVKPARFLVSIALNGILFVVKLFFWAFTIWLAARLIFGAERAPGDIFLLVCLGSAPYVFGVFDFMPYLGHGLRWVLGVYSWLVTVFLVTLAYSFSPVSAVVCTLGGWLLIEIASAMLARPREMAQDWLWRKTTGAPTMVTFDEQIEELTQRLQYNKGAREIAGAEQ